MTLICSTTREFRGVCTLDEPPMGMEFTPIDPPADWRTPSGGVWILEGDVWIDTPDHRGQTWHDPATGVEVVIDAVGAPPQGYVLGSPCDPRGAALSRLAAIRYARETGGTKLPNGALVLTGRTDQAMTTQAFVTLRDGLVDEIDWKGADGWHRVTLAELEPVARAVAAHVQRCFSAERAVSEQIAALPDADIPAFDLTAAWDAAWSTV